MGNQQKYKQTEIGSIPEDWEVRKLGEVAEIKRGKFTPRPRNDPRFYGGNIPFVQTGDVTYSQGKINNYSQTLNKDGLAVSTLFKKGTILMTIAANIGYTGVLQVDMACPDSLVAINGGKNYDNEYLNSYFTYKRQELELISTPGAQKNLSVEILKNFIISLPLTKAEQTAIATALNDADALITQLEKLIAKKRQIKQGAMQELLRPKEGWVEKKLGEEIDFQGGSQPPLSTFIGSAREGYIRLLQIRDYKTDKYETFIPTKLARKFCKKDDIMIGRYGPPLFQILRGLEGAYNVALIKAIPSSNVNKDFAYHFLKQDSLFAFIEKLSQRTGGQTGIDMEELKGYKFPLPSREEQAQIAQTLSDMDAEIESLEKKLEKYRKIKEGMMQNLLTGKIRLI